MKKAQSVFMAIIMVLLLCIVAKADWVPADGHKMHWAQEPDPFGWDIMASEPFIVADDWWCSQSGWVKDIHFWGSWRGGYIPPLTELYGFWISIHEDIPASQNPNGPYSQPGTVLLNNFYPIEDFIVAGPFFGEQGWFDPIQGEILFFDHFEYFQYNLFLPGQDWVWQEMETIYWLNISAVVFDPFNFPWGWKTTTHDLIFQDTSVWTDQVFYPDPWFPIYDPLIGPPEHLDLAFVITGEPDQQPTIQPQIATECPVVTTECPAIETVCPEWGDTYCPVADTQCPKVETLCPFEETFCPEFDPTFCPYIDTECFQAFTWCPIDTFCPDAPTFCYPLPTVCEVLTSCPDDPTFCPLGQFIPTVCPMEVTVCPEIPTSCFPDIPTECPVFETFCPGDWTYCPLNYTWCPGDVPTECPMDWTNCPAIPTVCPESFTVCPEVITICPTSPTFCSTVDTDGDGVDDCNDNCPNHPNGPLQGTCTLATPDNLIVSTGQFCTVDADCDPGEFCEKVQADNYPPGGNSIGDACDCEGNFDCDVDVDGLEVTAFLIDFGRGGYFSPCTNSLPCNGDFLCDGDVDGADVTKFLEDFGRGQYFQPCPICPGGPWCVYP